MFVPGGSRSMTYDGGAAPRGGPAVEAGAGGQFALRRIGTSAPLDSHTLPLAVMFVVGVASRTQLLTLRFGPNLLFVTVAVKS